MAANQANILKGIGLLWESFQYLGGEMPSIVNTGSTQRSTGRGRGRTARSKTPATQNVAGNITAAAPQAQTRRKYTRRKQAGQA